MCSELYSQYDMVLDILKKYGAGYFKVEGSSESKQAFLLVLKSIFFMICNCYSSESYIFSKIQMDALLEKFLCPFIVSLCITDKEVI